MSNVRQWLKGLRYCEKRKIHKSLGGDLLRILMMNMILISFMKQMKMILIMWILCDYGICGNIIKMKCDKKYYTIQEDDLLFELHI